MKKFLTSRIFVFILGAVIFGGITAVSAYTLFANQIKYTPSDNTWEVNNVESALNSLQTDYKEIVNEKNVRIRELENTIDSLSSSQVKIIKIGDYNSINAQTIDIKTKLPNDYANLTINNFVFLNVRHIASGGSNPDQNNDLLASYDNNTGILKLNSSRHRASSYDFSINYTIGCILGTISIQ